MFNMQDIYFKSDEEALIKLKEIGILSKTKEVSDLSEIIYKENGCGRSKNRYNGDFCSYG